MVRDIGRAEELAQDAFVSALTQWPETGIPRSPGAWLMTAAKRRAIDQVRRAKSLERKTEELGRDVAMHEPAEEFGVAHEEIDDDLLRMMFVACHPVLSTDARVALTLRLLGGLTTGEIARAEKLGGTLGPYALQAEIAACHARARTPEQTDWERIVALYDALAQLVPTPVVNLNRAVAVGMAFGPQAGLEIVDTLVEEPTLKTYHLLPSVRADLLFKLDRFTEARAEFERAASLAENARDRTYLLERAAACRF